MFSTRFVLPDSLCSSRPSLIVHFPAPFGAIFPDRKCLLTEATDTRAPPHASLLSATACNAIIMARPQNKRTTVRKHIKGIDHVVITVRDLNSAQDMFRRMGFTLTPRGHHTLGSQNHCVMFGRDYFELLMVPQRLPGREYYYDFVRIGDGLAAVALKTDNARGAYGELTAAALAPSEPVDFSRPVQLPEGTENASFRITQLGLEQTPGGHVFVCQHFTRDVVWRPEYQTHPNTATGLAAIAILSPGVPATA